MNRILMIAICMICLMASCKNQKSENIPLAEDTADNTLSDQEISDGWKLLFDGSTLNGWKMYQDKPADAWDVMDGVIYCKGSDNDKSDLRADLVSVDSFENFEITIDWKISPQGNSGIMYHVSEEYGASYLSGPEYQLIDDEGFPENLEEWQKTAADYAMYAPASRPVNPVGEFNTTKIVVNGAHREHWLNGVKVLEFEAWSPNWEKRKAEGKWKDTPEYGMSKSGKICLQDHGGGVWFKNIKIRIL